MRIIAHRGLTSGPDKFLENSPGQIQKAILKNYDIEIDIWFAYDSYWLGHDSPTYPLTTEMLGSWANKNMVYVHCKDIYTLQKIMEEKDLSENIIPFFHENDPCILLENGVLWVHPNSIKDARMVVGKTIFVVPDATSSQLYKNCYGICTDFADSVSKY
jgi:hypothetical protein